MIVGAGFGGLQAAKALRKAPVRVVVVDRSNYHLFQPFLYQVATAGLSPADIAQPIRSILGRQTNVEVLLSEAAGVDAKTSELILSDGRRIGFDYLILATGVRHSYLGHPEWEPYAPGLKSLDDATLMRRNILLAFERAEASDSEQERREWLNFVIVGGGPTGVELAGAIAEIAVRAMPREFDHIDPAAARIVLVEASPRVLPAFPEDLSEKTLQSLVKLGVEVMTDTRVTKVADWGVETSRKPIRARTVLWAAGVEATPVAKWLGAKADNVGRVLVNADLSVPGVPEVFVIGDAATLIGPDGQPLPGVCQTAMQEGVYAAKAIIARIAGRPALKAFAYNDKGTMATIGRKLAVGKIGRLHISGALAWLFWIFLHVWYLIGFRNKLLVMIQWAWSYVTFQRGARLITGLDRLTQREKPS